VGPRVGQLGRHPRDGGLSGAQRPSAAVRDVLTDDSRRMRFKGVLALENSFNRWWSRSRFLLCAWHHARGSRRCSAVRVIRSSTRFRMRGSTGGPLAHVSARTPIPVLGRAGRPVMRPVVRFAMRCSRSRERWATRPRSAQRLGFSGCVVQGNALALPQEFGSYVMGEHPVQNLVPGGVPCADRGRGGDDSAPAGARSARQGEPA